jgi:hypothetical protein
VILNYLFKCKKSKFRSIQSVFNKKGSPDYEGTLHKLFYKKFIVHAADVGVVAVAIDVTKFLTLLL